MIGLDQEVVIHTSMTCTKEEEEGGGGGGGGGEGVPCRDASIHDYIAMPAKLQQGCVGVAHFSIRSR